MSDLSLFFAQNAGAAEPVEFVVSSRFKDAAGQPIPWKLRSMSEAENEEIRQSATKRVPVKKGVTMPETNPTEYVAKLIVASVTFPNLRDSKLQESYGVMGAESLLRKMLLPGEYAALAEKVQELNGYDRDMNEDIEAIKN